MGRAIRPPDPAIAGKTLAYMPIGSAEACRRMVDLAFRDAASVLDLTYAAGNFWRKPLPPGLTVTTNNLNPQARTDFHLDFTATGLPSASYDLVVYDPPHIADAGAASILGQRYGTARGSDGLFDLVTAGVREAWRVSRVGIVVKLADTSHGGRYLQLSRWVYDSLGVEPYFVSHTTRRPIVDPKWKVQRVPLSNGAVYLVWRHDGGSHVDFDALWRRHALRIGGATRCGNCNAVMLERRPQAATCSSACRQMAYRRRRGSPS
jgi:hypothetical protein